MEEKDNSTERDLVIKFRDAYANKKELERQLGIAKDALSNIESTLLVNFEAQDKTCSAQYEGIGYCRAAKPKLRANCKKENEHRLFEFLETEKRADLIKRNVPPASLSGYVTERLGDGKEIPEFVNYALIDSIKFYPEK